MLLLSVFNPAFGQKVTLDYFFNHEVHLVGGVSSRYHYLWTDKANSGFSVWGDVFKKQGAILDTLGIAPTVENLSGSAVYIIVDPDTKKENTNPNYINTQDADQLAKWVNAGGQAAFFNNI